jgi:hypothetical protein
MRIRREPAAWFHFPAEVFQLFFGEPAFEISAGVNSRRGVSLKINHVAVAGFRGRMKEVIERHFVKRRRRCERGNVSADAFLKLVGADDHGHRVPAHQALNAAFHFLASGKRRLRL